MVLWVAVDDSVGTGELLTGAGAAATAAFLTETVSRQASISFRIKQAWLLPAVRLPGQVARETLIVFAALWQRLAHGQQPPSGFVAEPVGA